MDGANNVSIPFERYNELLSCEIRLSIIFDCLKNDADISKEEFYLIFGDPIAYQVAKDKKMKEEEKWRKRYESKIKNTDSEKESVVPI